MKRETGAASELFLKSTTVLAQLGFIEVHAADVVDVEGVSLFNIAAVVHW